MDVNMLVYVAQFYCAGAACAYLLYTATKYFRRPKLAYACQHLSVRQSKRAKR